MTRSEFIIEFACFIAGIAFAVVLWAVMPDFPLPNGA